MYYSLVLVAINLSIYILMNFMEKRVHDFYLEKNWVYVDGFKFVISNIKN